MADDTKAVGRAMWEWRNALNAADLTPNVKVVGLQLASHANSKTGECWPSQDTLAAGTGLNPRTVRRAMTTLATDGWIVRTRAHSPGRSARYRLATPVTPDSTPDSTQDSGQVTPDSPGTHTGQPDPMTPDSGTPLSVQEPPTREVRRTDTAAAATSPGAPAPGSSGRLAADGRTLPSRPPLALWNDETWDDDQGRAMRTVTVSDDWPDALVRYGRGLTRHGAADHLAERLFWALFDVTCDAKAAGLTVAGPFSDEDRERFADKSGRIDFAAVLRARGTYQVEITGRADHRGWRSVTIPAALRRIPSVATQ